MNTSCLSIFVALLTISLASVACGASDSGSANQAGDITASQSASSAGSTASNSIAPDAPASNDSGALRVIQTTSLTLSVKDLSESYSRVTDLVRSHGGYVAAADVSSGSNASTGLISVRVPAREHASLVTSLKGLPDAGVNTEKVEAKEVTADYTDLQSRLRNLERAEAQYPQFLTQAKNIDEVLNVNNRLHTTRDEIERTTGRIRLFDNQVEYATVNLNLTTLPPARAAEGRATPLEVFADAWQVSVEGFWVSSILAPCCSSSQSG